MRVDGWSFSLFTLYFFFAYSGLQPEHILALFIIVIITIVWCFIGWELALAGGDSVFFELILCSTTCYLPYKVSDCSVSTAGSLQQRSQDFLFFLELHVFVFVFPIGRRPRQVCRFLSGDFLPRIINSRVRVVTRFMLSIMK